MAISYETRPSHASRVCEAVDTVAENHEKYIPGLPGALWDVEREDLQTFVRSLEGELGGALPVTPRDFGINVSDWTDLSPERKVNLSLESVKDYLLRNGNFADGKFVLDR